jgi:mRNA interferase HicA
MSLRKCFYECSPAPLRRLLVRPLVLRLPHASAGRVPPHRQARNRPESLADFWLTQEALLRRRLANAGCAFVDGKKHLIIYYKGKRSLMPRHPAEEVKIGTVQGILKRLGIEDL